MSCIITYKGQKYSEEQFKEYFINNKNEFTTSIAKNKNVIDSFKRKMEGIDNVFSQSPELASIGSKTQYLQYLSTIFKTSKVKDIVYHGTNKEFDKFESDFNYYFSSNLEIAKGYSTKFAENPKPNVKSVILNIKTPHIVNGNNSDWFKIQLDNKTTRSIGNIVRDGIENNNDGVVINNVKDGLDKTDIISNINVVFEPEQIHILSSKKDLEMFRNFINFTKSEYAKYGDIQQFKDYIMSKNFAAVEEFLVVNNKIDRKC